MKRVLSLALVAGIAFSLGLLLRSPIQRAGAAGKVAGRGAQANDYFACGDSNGDGFLNIADPVHTLRYLFNEAPEPVCEAVPGGRLLATGQTLCYDDRRNEVPCDSAAFPGQDGFYQVGCPMEARFVDNGDGTVTDNCTGLMWQKDTADVNGDGMTAGTFDDVTWQEALKYCENLEFAGHTDWRLPNVRELQSIVAYWRSVPAIDPAFWVSTHWHWSSSSLAGNPSAAWYVDFYVGNVGIDAKGNADFVRAVRSVQPGE